LCFVNQDNFILTRFNGTCSPPYKPATCGPPTAASQADSNASLRARYGDMRCRGRLRGSRHRNSSTVAHHSTRPADCHPPLSWGTEGHCTHQGALQSCVLLLKILTNPAQLRQEACAGPCLRCWRMHLQMTSDAPQSLRSALWRFSKATDQHASRCSRQWTSAVAVRCDVTPCHSRNMSRCNATHCALPQAP
jgi:hypothetical protein